MSKVYKQYLRCESCYNPFINEYIIEKVDGKQTVVPKGKNIQRCPLCFSALIENEKKTARHPEDKLPEGFSFGAFDKVIVLPIQERELKKTEIRKEFLKCPVCDEKFVNDFEVREINDPSIFYEGVLTIRKSHFQAVAIKPVKTCPDCGVYLVDDVTTANKNKDILMTDEIMREFAGISDSDGFFASTDKANRERSTKAEIKEAKENRKKGLLSKNPNMLGKTLNDFCEALNNQLQKDGYRYSFKINKDDQDVDFFGDRKNQENIVLFNQDKTQKIVFYDDNKEGELYFLSVEKDIEYDKTFDNVVKEIYRTVVEVLEDNFATMIRKNKNDEMNFFGCTIPNSLDTKSKSFIAEEEILRKHGKNLTFISWSGNVSENVKLKLIKESKFIWM